MKRRRYSVWNNSRKNRETFKTTITEYFVTDADNEKELEDRPAVASFPVCQLYEAAEQKARAEAYREFMNRIVDATEDAYKNNALIDILKQDMK